MNDRREPDDERHSDERLVERRRQYVKPSFTREEVFETTALSCGKINPNVGQCSVTRKTS